MPLDFVNVLNHALMILSWQENLPSDEMPPYWMWHLDWEIEDWFRKVQRKRDAKYGTVRDEEVEEEYEENDLFDDFLQELKGQ